MPVERMQRPAPALARAEMPAEPADRHARRRGVLGSIERPRGIVTACNRERPSPAAPLFPVSLPAAGGALAIGLDATQRLVAA
jgi:hypothetical protein